MNNIFFKNLNALNSKNPALAQKLQTFVPTELPKLTQNNNAYNIEYKSKLIHNPQNPLGEAIEIFKNCENTPVSIHLIYGMGLGYLFQVASLNSQGTVILYEPDLNILWFAFTLVDFSNDISKPNVYVTDEFEKMTMDIYQKSGMKNSPVLLSLPTQREFDPKDFNNFVSKLQNIIGSFALDLKYTQNRFYSSLKMLITNIPKLLNETPLIKLKDQYKGKTAIIVSAGPTLDRNIETLKKYRNNYVLFTVGTAVKTLFKNDITPDFLCIIESFNCSKQIEGLDLSNVNFITEPYSNPILHNFKFKNIYSHISANTPINHLWAEICNENIDEYWSKGTVSYTAINCARILGCSKIILVGQDLAYIEGQCYSKDSAYKDLYCRINPETNAWEITAKNFADFANAISASPDPAIRERTAKDRLKNLNSSLHYVKGIKGDLIPTESVYATFVKPLQEFTETFNDREYINTSLIGAQIDGFENMSLEQALENSQPIGNIELTCEFKYNRTEILENLKIKLQEVKQAIPKIEEGKQISRNLKNDILRYKAATTDILKTLKKLSLNYIEVTGELANNSKILEYLVTSFKIDLDYEMKMMREFNAKNITELNKKLASFYENIEKRITIMERIINESINTAS